MDTRSRAVELLEGSADQKEKVKKVEKSSLEEQEFSEALTEIIRRDFFPDVEKLESEVGDSRKANVDCTTESQAKKFPQDEENITNPCDDNALRADKQELGLDQFLNKYQSEDDASFSDILERYKEQHHQKHAWLHEKEEAYAAKALPSSATLALPSSAETTITNNEEQPRAILGSWPYTAKNSLMYIPDGVESSVVEVVEGASKKRAIVHSNTRLPDQFTKKFRQVARVGCNNFVSDKIGVDGKAESDGESPKMKGYGFMVTPQIHPGVDASPLMTWGSIEGTPQRLEMSTPVHGPSFKFSKESAREKVALKLADEVAKARTKKKAVTASPLLKSHLGATPSQSERLQLLSPASRVWSQRSNTDKALLASYTPKALLRKTPLVVKTPSERTGSVSRQNTPHLTDNLLNLQKN